MNLQGKYIKIKKEFHDDFPLRPGGIALVTSQELEDNTETCQVDELYLEMKDFTDYNKQFWTTGWYDNKLDPVLNWFEYCDRTNERVFLEVTAIDEYVEILSYEEAQKYMNTKEHKINTRILGNALDDFETWWENKHEEGLSGLEDSTRKEISKKAWEEAIHNSIQKHGFMTPEIQGEKMRTLKIITVFIGLKLYELTYIPLKFIVKIPWYIIKGITKFSKWLFEESYNEDYKSFNIAINRHKTYKNYRYLFDIISFMILIILAVTIYIGLVFLISFALMHIFTEHSFTTCLTNFLTNDNVSKLGDIYEFFVFISIFLSFIIGLLVYFTPAFIKYNIEKAKEIVDRKSK